VYNIPKAFTRLPVAKALKKVQNELKKENLGLKIFDAYRPYSVTVQFFKKVKDTNYVASPKKGSRHNRGCAVDLTIIDLKTGKEIEMPTAYDDFTEKAASNFNDLPVKIIENREKLKKIMANNGFKVFYTEWWHYDFNGWENYELVDISFEELSGLEKNKE
jgi:D-alanyl-D-alanine dipeptidase